MVFTIRAPCGTKGECSGVLEDIATDALIVFFCVWRECAIGGRERVVPADGMSRTNSGGRSLIFVFPIQTIYPIASSRIVEGLVVGCCIDLFGC